MVAKNLQTNETIKFLFGGDEFIEGKYISNILWNDSLLVKHSKHGCDHARFSARIDC